jgi:hypothetical protein
VSDRFRFALEHTQPSHWQLFEYLASTFVATEHGELRTLASLGGDGGRDATLYQPLDDETVALQYSVSDDWKDKIRRTARRLSEVHPEVKWLIYASPQRIGASADELKIAIRQQYRLHLDVRDQNWFAEREHRSAAASKAADRFATQIVDPLLRGAGVIDHGGIELTNDESRAALLYLVLQRQDDSQARGLTRLCFDAIVKALLRDTSNDNRMARVELHTKACDLLPSHDPEEIKGYVDRALDRMDRRYLRHYRQEDTWLLNHEERLRLAEGVARLAVLDSAFTTEIETHLLFVADSLQVDVHLIDSGPLLARIRRILERFLYERGESFAEGVANGQAVLFAGSDLEECVRRDLLRKSDTTSLRDSMLPLITTTIERTLIQHSDTAQQLLRAVVDGYTLFAFLRETPNVQSAVTKLFAQGEFWLDTTAVLPLMAERLLSPEKRGYGTILRAATDAGARLYVTPGVVDELSSHIDISLQAWRNPGTWRSRTPFLLQAFLWSGRPSNQFSQWIEYFRGSARPEDDLTMFLLEECRISVVGFADLLTNVPDDLRWQSDSYWESVHGQRRRRSNSELEGATDPEIVKRLARHDSETFLGVIERRKGEQVNNPFGYTTWWLTLDRAAVQEAAEVTRNSGYAIPHSPVVSFEFLTYYLMVGPARRQLERNTEQQLPIAIDSSLLDTLPKDLLDAAERARRDVEGQDERLVRRKIRDHLDGEKISRGKTARSGLETIKDDLRAALTGR